MLSTTHALAAGLAVALTTIANAQQRHWTQRDRVPSGPVVYDGDRGRAVSFRGGNLLEWNGTGWFRRDGSIGPAPVASHVMGYHAATGKTVLVGGFDGRGYPLWTNVWDGAEWTIPPGSGPGGRTNAAMVYDSLRQRLVLFGGGRFSLFDDTWEWNGSTWTERSVATRPPARHEHAMAYDAARNVTVLFGGNGIAGLNDTWEWDGTTWTERLVIGPPTAFELRMEFDAARGVSVLIADDETWEWNGAQWARRSTINPLGRAELFYDPTRRAVVALGEGAALWSWSGSAWRLLEPRLRHPGPFRDGLRLVYDSARERIVTYQLAATSEWDGTRWTVRDISPAPVLSRHALAYDPVRAETVLFGGISRTTPGPSDQTWVWDGAQWTQRQPVNAPSPRSDAAMAWDPINQRVLLFGGEDPNPLLDTWAWDGTNWTQLQPANAPPAPSEWITTDPVRARIVLPVRNQGTWEWDGTNWIAAGGLPRNGSGPLAYDAGLGVTVMRSSFFGTMAEWDGATWTERSTLGSPGGFRSDDGDLAYHAALGATVLFRGDTWVYGTTAPAQTNVGPVGCASGTQPTLVTAGTPWLGHDAFAIDLVGGAPQRPGAILVGAAARSTPFASCTLHVDLAQPLASAPVTTTAFGFASAALPVPLDPTFAGVRLFTQGASIDASQPDPVRLTNLLELVVGN